MINRYLGLLSILVIVTVVVGVSLNANAKVWELGGKFDAIQGSAAGTDPISGDLVLYTMEDSELYGTSLTKGQKKRLAVALEISKTSSTTKGVDFGQSYFLAVDREGKVIISDLRESCIKQYDPRSQKVSIIAGRSKQPGMSDGSLERASFRSPRGIAVDQSNKIIVADSVSIREIDRTGDQVTTIADKRLLHEDAATLTHLSHPYGVAIDRDNNVLFSDMENNVIRRLNRKQRLVETLDPQDPEGMGPAGTVFRHPVGIAIDVNDPEGSVLIADEYRVTRLNSSSSHPVLTTVLSDTAVPGFHPEGVVSVPGGIFVTNRADSAATNVLFVAAYQDAHEEDLDRSFNEGVEASSDRDKDGFEEIHAKLTRLAGGQTDIAHVTEAMGQARQNRNTNYLASLPKDLVDELKKIKVHEGFKAFRARMALEKLNIANEKDEAKWRSICSHRARWGGYKFEPWLLPGIENPVRTLRKSQQAAAELTVDPDYSAIRARFTELASRLLNENG